MTTEQNETDEDRIKGLPVTLENPGFAADEMIACGKCGRSNPPNRLRCFYCGSDIIVSPKYSEAVRPTLRRLEEWEKGFNVVLLKRNNSPDLRSIAGALGLERDALAKILDSGGPMPLARVESRPDADLIQTRLGKFDVECAIVSDEELEPTRPPRRLRAVGFQTDSIFAVDFNTAEKRSIASNDISLIVTGKLFSLKTHSFEKRKKGKAKLIDQSDTSTDESVIDIYTRDDPSGYRIYESGFDFSCLGNEKSLLAADNMPRLIKRLSEVSLAAKRVDAYSAVRDALDVVWELSSHKDFEGLRRSGFGKADFGNVVTVDNLAQFTRYSRMLRLLT